MESSLGKNKAAQAISSAVPAPGHKIKTLVISTGYHGEQPGGEAYNYPA